MSTIIGFARSFAPSYLWFLFLEFLDTAFGSGAYSSGFILGKLQVFEKIIIVFKICFMFRSRTSFTRKSRF